MMFQEKCFSCYIAFTSLDIGQYVYYNCLLTSLWRHKIWNLVNEKSFWGDIKSIFHHFKRAFSCIALEDKFVSSESIPSRTSLYSYLVSWKIYLFTCRKSSLWAAQKWLFHSANFCDWGMKKHVFCGINFCDVGILWKKCEIYFCSPDVLTKFFQPSVKKEIRYIWE